MYSDLPPIYYWFARSKHQSCFWIDIAASGKPAKPSMLTKVWDNSIVDIPYRDLESIDPLNPTVLETEYTDRILKPIFNQYAEQLYWIAPDSYGDHENPVMALDFERFKAAVQHLRQ